MKHIFFLATILSFIIAEINFTGDARIRPRLDIINEAPKNGDSINDKSSMDLYYLYRGCLNIDADIGGDWFFKAKLGTNDVAGMVKMSNSSQFNNGVSNPNSFRPQVSFLNLYYGIKKENFGFWGGAFPLKYNPSLDLHFHPDKVVDIPWLLWNNGSTTGFAGYIYKLNWFVSIDENKKETNKDLVKNYDEKNMDSFTLGIDFPLSWNDMLNIHPRALFSFDNTDEPWPMTFGADFNIRSFFGITPQISYHLTKQFINKDYKYSLTHVRLKLDRKFGSGKLTFWADLASHMDEMNDSYTTDYTYLWIDYKCQLFKSDFGSVSIKPTIRLLFKDTIDSEYSRMKFELTTEIKFK